jgi:hypothetical protein
MTNNPMSGREMNCRGMESRLQAAERQLRPGDSELLRSSFFRAPRRLKAGLHTFWAKAGKSPVCTRRGP